MKSARPYIFFSLIFLNLILFAKLNFFIPQLIGKAQLLDFETYLMLVEDIRRGVNPYTVSYMQTLGPPSVFIYFLPFSIFNLHTAKFLYTLINILCGFAMCHLLSKKFFRKDAVNLFLFLVLLYFSSFPVRFSIEMGQPNLVITYLISSLICTPKTKYLNIFLGLLVTIKVNYVIALIPYVRKNLKVVIKTFFTVLFIVVLLLPIIKPSYYLYYLENKNQNLLPSIKQNESLNYYNQSIPARLNTFGFDIMTTPLFLVTAIIVLLMVYKSQNLLLGIISSIILSPVSWQHYFAVLFPIIFITYLKVEGFLHKLILFTAFFLWWVEFPVFHSLKPNLFTAFFSSHYLISAVIIFFIIYKNRINITSASK